MENKMLFEKLRGELRGELTGNILPFWMEKMADQANGGFYGRMDGSNTLHPDTEKGCILHARILWAFSAAYRILGDERYLRAATRAKDFLIGHFWDTSHGGMFWSVQADGSPKDTKKQIYAQGFAIYGLSQYYRVTSDEQSLAYAQELFSLIEKYSYDPLHGGYLEAFDRQWRLLEDLRLSEKDANELKTMNTHLHILESYTNLLRVCDDSHLRERHKELIGMFTRHIVDEKTAHLKLFFKEDWTCRSQWVSYGHDIEAVWLLWEAAEVLGDASVSEGVRGICLRIAQAAAEGLQRDGSMIYEYDPVSGHTDTQRHWWVQNETVAGMAHMYRFTGDTAYLKAAIACWEYSKENLLDRVNGEWYWGVYSDGTPNTKDDKAGFWKCPYHNARMCMEVMSL